MLAELKEFDYKQKHMSIGLMVLVNWYRHNLLKEVEMCNQKKINKKNNNFNHIMAFLYLNSSHHRIFNN